MRAGEIAAVIEEFASLDRQEEWDNSGFCIGNPDVEVKGVLVGFDCTLPLVEEAVSKGVNMIVTHHPLIFHGLKIIDPSDRLGSIVAAAIKNDIVVYAAHTNADKVLDGVSGLMADKLHLQNRRFLDESGLGIVGDLPETMIPTEFIDYVKKQFAAESVRTSEISDGHIRRVALCGGSGSSLIGQALSSGADVYVSADLGYHSFFTQKGFMVMDIGHYESEVDIVEKLFALLKKKIHNFAILKSENNTNPIHYF